MARELKVGDYLYESWGYDQTNVNFYKVVALAGKTSVKIIPVMSQTISGAGGPTTYVIPTDTPAKHDVLLVFKPKGEKYPRSWKEGDGPITKLCKGKRASLGDRYSADLWDGEPCYETGWGFGH